MKEGHENTKPLNHKDLSLRIARLKADRVQQEKELKQNYKDLVENFNFGSLVKESFRKLSEDKELKLEVMKTGLNVGADFIVKRVFRKQSFIKSLLGGTIEIFTAKFINDHSSTIITGIEKLFRRRSEKAA